MPKHRGASRSATSNDRAVNYRSRHQRILIICEGVQTEPNYFTAIIRIHRLNGRVVQGRSLDVSVKGLGTNTLSLVEHAQRQLQTFDEAWSVFDKDSFPDDNFDNAIAKIVSTPKLFAAWSNEAFELWYILHFEYLNSCPAGSAGRPQYIVGIFASEPIRAVGAILGCWVLLLNAVELQTCTDNIG